MKIIIKHSPENTRNALRRGEPLAIDHDPALRSLHTNTRRTAVETAQAESPLCRGHTSRSTTTRVLQLRKARRQLHFDLRQRRDELYIEGLGDAGLVSRDSCT